MYLFFTKESQRIVVIQPWKPCKYMLQRGASALIKDHGGWLRFWALLPDRQPVPESLLFHYQNYNPCQVT